MMKNIEDIIEWMENVICFKYHTTVTFFICISHLQKRTLKIPKKDHDVALNLKVSGHCDGFGTISKAGNLTGN